MENNFDLPLTIHRFPSLASTNQTLWEMLDREAKAGTVVISGEQTLGRGQWGRRWESGLGGLYLSLAIATDWEAARSGELTMAIAWGIATVFRTAGVPLQLKYPNDLFLLHRKLGGILTETKIHRGRIATAVIGVGINWSNPVPPEGINLQSYWQSQGLTPSIPSLEVLGTIALEGITLGYGQLITSGLDSFLLDYEKLLIAPIPTPANT